MKRYEDWGGTVAGERKVIAAIKQSIKEKYFPEIDQKMFNQVFLEAFCRNLVQNELVEMMIYILEEE